jgi:hypothetical protein
MDFSNLFSNGKSGPGPRRVDRAARLESIVGQGSADKRARWCLAGVRRPCVRAHRWSPAAVEEDEPDEAVPEGCSLEHERRRNRGEEQRWLEGEGRHKGARERGGKGAVRAGGARCLL